MRGIKTCCNVNKVQITFTWPPPVLHVSCKRWCIGRAAFFYGSTNTNIAPKTQNSIYFCSDERIVRDSTRMSETEHGKLSEKTKLCINTCSLNVICHWNCKNPWMNNSSPSKLWNLIFYSLDKSYFYFQIYIIANLRLSYTNLTRGLDKKF